MLDKYYDDVLSMNHSSIPRINPELTTLDLGPIPLPFIFDSLQYS